MGTLGHQILAFILNIVWRCRPRPVQSSRLSFWAQGDVDEPPRSLL